MPTCWKHAGILVALVALGGSSSGVSAWGWDACACDDIAAYAPAPRYVHDHRKGPTWTGNGWVYLPVGQHRSEPPEYGPGPLPPLPPPGYRGDGGLPPLWHLPGRVLGLW